MFETKEHLEAYLNQCSRDGTVPLFTGPQEYRNLLDTGFLLPDLTAVRLQNPESMDQYYVVAESGKLEGQSHLSVHAGRAGLFDFTDLIMEGQRFELENWRRF